ncbi:hypothetical protein GQ600_15693 [Phytophthora cactorum]|nr:hypothetical protein GQ600_15693 [Phytophthora cactorum]
MLGYALHLPLKNSFRPQEKLLISPTERDILRDARNTMFTPSPQIAQDADHLAEDSDEEDPGDGVSDAATLALWGKYLDEVFQDEELDIVYTEAGTSLNSTCCAEQDYEDDNEFEEIPAAVISSGTQHIWTCFFFITLFHPPSWVLSIL